MSRFEQCDKELVHLHQQLDEHKDKVNNLSEISSTHLTLGRGYFRKHEYHFALHHFAEAERSCRENNSYRRGRVLLFRALCEIKANQSDAEDTVKEAYRCVMLTAGEIPEDVGARNDTFATMVKQLCCETPDLAPELVELMVITGDRLLNKRKLPSLALPHYKNALCEMEKHLSEHKMLSTYVIEAIAICEGRLGCHEAAVGSWLKLVQRIMASSCETETGTIFKARSYDPIESFWKNIFKMKAAVFGLRDADWGIRVLETIATSVSKWVTLSNNATLVPRISAVLHLFLGELYEQTERFSKGCIAYVLAKFLLRSVDAFQKSDRFVTERIQLCFSLLKGELDLTGTANLIYASTLLENETTGDLLGMFEKLSAFLDHVPTIEREFLLFIFKVLLKIFARNYDCSYGKVLGTYQQCRDVSLNQSVLDSGRYEKLLFVAGVINNAGMFCYGKLLKAALFFVTDEITKTGATSHKSLILAAWLVAVGRIWKMRALHMCAKLAFQHALHHLKALSQNDVALQFDDFCATTLHLAAETEHFGFQRDLQNQRDILLNHPRWVLPNSVRYISSLLRLFQPPFDAVTDQRRLTKLLLDIASSPALGTWQLSGVECLHTLSAINRLVKSILVLPQDVGEEIDLRSLGEAFQSICSHPLVPFTIVPEIKAALTFVAVLNSRVQSLVVLDTLLGIATMYMRTNFPADAEECLTSALRRFVPEVNDERKKYWYKVRCLVDLSWCCMKQGQMEKAWYHLGEAMAFLQRFNDTRQLRALRQKHQSRERSPESWQNAREYVLQCLDS